MSYWKVCVRCCTYNHAAYITDALNGFVIQQLEVPFVAVVIDDASTDGTRQILLEYLSNYFDKCEWSTEYEKETDEAIIWFRRHKSNHNCYFAIVVLKFNHYSRQIPKQYILDTWERNSEYIAICDGDDYWIDSLKLQKQIDFLDLNPSYGVCHTDFILSDGRPRRHYREKHPNGNYFPAIVTKNDISIGTLTAVYRRTDFEKTPMAYLGKKFVAGDYPRWIEMSKITKIKYLADRTAAYRVLAESASHSMDVDKALHFIYGLTTIREFYAELYELPLDYKTHYTNLLRTSYIHKDYIIARKVFKEAYKNKCITIRGLFFYLGIRYKWIHRLIDIVYIPR